MMPAPRSTKFVRAVFVIVFCLLLYRAYIFQEISALENIICLFAGVLGFDSCFFPLAVLAAANCVLHAAKILEMPVLGPLCAKAFPELSSLARPARGPGAGCKTQHLPERPCARASPPGGTGLEPKGELDLDLEDGDSAMTVLRKGWARAARLFEDPPKKAAFPRSGPSARTFRAPDPEAQWLERLYLRKVPQCPLAQFMDLRICDGAADMQDLSV